jgi:hypothetical protein
MVTEEARRHAACAGCLFCLRLKHLDEQRADDLSLRLGVGDACERVEKQRLRLHVHERDVVAVAE